MSIQKGDKAPSFTLRASDTSEISLASYQGNHNVLLLFFPLAFTGVCTKELCSMQEDLSKYQELNAKIIGISVDSPFTLAKFKEENKLSFPLVSDFNKDVSRAYFALYDEFVFGMKGVSKRSAFVIDKEGNVKYAEVLDNAGDLPDFATIEKTLTELN